MKRSGRIFNNNKMWLWRVDEKLESKSQYPW